MSLSKFNDNEIREEFVARFKKKNGLKLKNARDVSNHLIAFFSEIDTSIENFVIIYLNGQNELIDTEVLFTGSINAAAVYPRIVIEKIIENKAANIIISHNHPSKELSPSSSDRALTKKINEATSSIDVDLLDHLIIGGSEYSSFSDMRLL
jgi:DNA repair protein RadC